MLFFRYGTEDSMRTREELYEQYYTNLEPHQIHYWFEKPLSGPETVALGEPDIVAIFPDMLEFISNGGVIANEDFDRFIVIGHLYWTIQLDSFLGGSQEQYKKQIIEENIELFATMARGEPFAIMKFGKTRVDFHDNGITLAVA